MPSPSVNLVRATSAGHATDSMPPPPIDSSTDLPLIRFRLQHVFYLVAVVSGLLAGLLRLPGLVGVALLLATLVVCLHLLATAVGVQLRRHASRNQPEGPFFHLAGTRPILPPAAPLGLTTDSTVPAQSRWYRQCGSPLAWMPQFVAVAAVLGGCLGGAYLAAAIGHRISLAGLIVGAISSAALSGWFAFLGASFISIVRGGMKAAFEPQHAKTPQPR